MIFLSKLFKPWLGFLLLVILKHETKRDENLVGRNQTGLDDFVNSQPIQIAKDATIQRGTPSKTCFGENIKAL